jgi:hypothetical protein
LSYFLDDFRSKRRSFLLFRLIVVYLHNNNSNNNDKNKNNNNKMSQSPVFVAVKKGKRKNSVEYGTHPFKALKDREINLSNADFLEICESYLTVAADDWADGCIPQDGSMKSRLLSCQCMIVFKDRDFGKETKKAVANWMLRFGGLSYVDQQMQMIEWIKYGEELGGFYKLPYCIVEGDDVPADALKHIQSIRLCRHALQHITDFRKDKWNNVSCCAETGMAPVDRRKGNTNRHDAFMKVHSSDLHTHFQLLRQHAAPRATLLVRRETGATETRDDDPDVEDLPTFISYRGSFKQFMWEQGYKVITDSKGRVETEIRTDPEWTRGEPANPPLAFSSYLSFWNRHYPKLRVQKASEDICGACFRFQHRMNALKERIEEIQAARDDDEFDEAGFQVAKEAHQMEAAGDDDVPELTRREYSELTAVSSPEEDELVAELDSISKHVKEARAQRELANEYLKKSKEDATNNTPHGERTYAMCADFAQNMEVPSFNSEQPGETYYFSPLTVNVFGIAEEFTKPGTATMTAFAYPEYDGKKGGDNVASLIMHFLGMHGLLDEEKGPGGKLVFIMDNCSGQNKNRMVLRLGGALVDLGYFKEVEFVFLIVGHTKNMCDRLFNLLKINYRKKNIYTVRQLIESCNEVPQVTAIQAEPGWFRNFDDYLDKYYRRLDKIKTKEWHIFNHSRYKLEPPLSTLKVRTSNLEDADSNEAVLHKMIKAPPTVILPDDQYQRNDVLLRIRQKSMKDDVYSMTMLPRPGLRAIKQVELYEKYRPYVPDEFKDETCPEPPPEVMEKHKKDKKEREQTRKRQKLNL